MEIEDKNIEVEISQSVSPSSGKWRNLSRYCLLILLFLLPLWVMPLSGFTLGLGKSFLIFCLTLLAAIFYLVHLLKTGELKLPRAFAFLSVFVILAVLLVSSLFSSTPVLSLSGASGFGTFFSLSIIFALFFLFVLLFQSESYTMKGLFLLLVSASVIFIFQLLHILFGVTLFGLLPDKFSNFVGSWNEISIFFGLICLISLVFLEILSSRFSQIPRGRMWRFFLLSLVGVSLLTMAFINFTVVWVLFAFFLLLLFVYLLSFQVRASGRNFAVFPVFVILLSMFFILAKPMMGDLVNALNFDFLEVRPSWSATGEVIKGTLGSSFKNLLVGSGPDTFVQDWIKFKPANINQSIFWDTRFQYGIGTLPTFLATTGIFGALGWLFLLGFIIYYGLKAINFPCDEINKSLFLGSFLGSVYLWVFNIVYTPGVFLFTLSLIMTALFFATLIRVGVIRTTEFHLFKKSAVGFVASLMVTLLLIISVAAFYTAFQKYLAAHFYGKGLVELNQQGDLDKAENSFSSAIQYDPQDQYYRALSNVGLSRLLLFINSQQQLTQEETVAQFQNLLAFTVQNAQNAIQANSSDPLNWKNLGQIYGNLVSLRVQGAREAALDAYGSASQVASSDPQPLFASAQVEASVGNFGEARQLLDTALSLKGNYTPALFLSAQISAQEGELTEAISKTEMARITAPSDVGILFQLGLLYFQDEKYKEAVTNLERAIAVNANYSNARYFLGLCYDRLGDKERAVVQFEKIAELNSDNVEVQKILENLYAGRSALSEISPPEPAPEEREEPPIEGE